MSSETNRPFEIELLLDIQTYDVDFAGVVSNIVYVRWLEDLRNGLLNQHFSLQRLLASGVLLAVAQTRIDYKAPLRLADRPKGRMWAKDVGEKYFLLEAEFVLDNQVVATAEQVAVFVGKDDWQPTNIPEELARMYIQMSDQAED